MLYAVCCMLDIKPYYRNEGGKILNHLLVLFYNKVISASQVIRKPHRVLFEKVTC